MNGFEKSPALGAIFDRVAVQIALRRAKKSAWRLPPMPAEQKALEERRYPEPPDMPVIPESPPIAPAQYVSEDERLQRRLDEYAARQRPLQAEQLSLL